MTIRSGTARGSNANLFMLLVSFLVEIKLNVLHQVIGCAQRGEGTSICPPALQDVVCHSASADIRVVDIRDFQFATMRRHQGRNHIKNLSIIHVDASDCQVALGIGWLLLDTQDMSVLRQLGHAKALGVLHLFEEDPRTPPLVQEGCNRWCKVVLEDVVPQDNTTGIARAETTSQSQGLGNAACLILHLVGEVQAEVMTTTQQLHDIAHVIATSDNKNILDASLLEACDGMKHHGVVAHGQEVLVGHSCQGRKTGTGATCQNNAFHCKPPRLISLGLRRQRHSELSVALQAVKKHSDVLAAHVQIAALFALPAALVEDA